MCQELFLIIRCLLCYGCLFQRNDDSRNLWSDYEMVKTGQEFDLSANDGVKVDKHSTGGVGDKVTLILAPSCCPASVCLWQNEWSWSRPYWAVQLINWSPLRAISRDVVKRVSFTKFRILVYLSLGNQTSWSKRISFSTPYVMWPQLSTRFLWLRVLSWARKLQQGGCYFARRDCRWGCLPMKTVDEARELAQTMVDLGKAVGRKTVAVITDMSQPLGRAIGNRLEILEALRFYKVKAVRILPTSSVNWLKLCLV